MTYMLTDRGFIIDGEAHISLTRPSRSAKILIAVAGPTTIAFEAYVDGQSRPTIYVDRSKAREMAEYLLKIA
jgi:hypothetical protein